MKLQPHTVKKYEEHVYNIVDQEKGMMSQATITLVDGKFAECHYPFVGNYTRDQWRVLAALESEIRLLEGNAAK
jgi:hypothetical protein